MKLTPKFSKVRNWLLDIATNPDSLIEKIPSERDICEILQLSRQTVRKGINSLIDEGILESTHGVGTFINRKAIKGYQLVKPQKQTIGIILFSGKEKFEIEHYIWGILEAVINVLSEKGFRIHFISFKNKRNIKWSLKAKQIISQGISSVLWFGPGKEEEKLIGLLREHDISTIVIGVKPVNKKYDYIIGDDFYGGFIAGEYFIKCGHHKILFISKYDDRPFIENRLNGFEQALFKYNLKVDDSLVFNNFSVREVYYELRNKLKENYVFSAIFVADGIYLNAVYNALKDEGKSIPNDISIISYDKSEKSYYPDIDLTEVIQPLYEMGTFAAKKTIKILQRQQNGTIYSIFKPKLIKGNTVAYLHKK